MQSLLGFVALCLLLRCPQGQGEVTPSAKLLDDLAERFWLWRLEDSPEYGTKVGIHTHDRRLEELNEEAFLGRKDKAEVMLGEASDIAQDDLDLDQGLSLSLLKFNLQSFVDGYPYRKFGQYNPVTPLEDPLLDWKKTFGRMLYKTEEDYSRMLARLREVPVRAEECIALMRLSIESGLTLHNSSLTGVVDRYQSEVADNMTSFFYAPLLNIPESIPPETRRAIFQNGSQTIQTVIFPALLSMASFLTEEYGPKTRAQIGVSSLPGGLQHYEQCLKWHITMDLSPDEVHQTGLSEVARIKTLMEQEMERNGFHGNLLTYIEYLKAQPENFYETEDEMIVGYQEIINATHSKLHQLFHDVPDIPCIVVKNPNRQSPGGRYSPPPQDGSQPGYFIANVYSHETKPTFNMAALTLHEAEPGHHLMATRAMARHSDVASFRRRVEYRKYYAVPYNFPFFTAMSEGWALYAESLGEEMGVYDTPHSLFGRYASEMFRAVRLVVDTGIHAFGWTKKHTHEYIANHTTLSPLAISNEVNRYISWPGQACSYKMGELKIKALRRKAENEMGDRFDIRTFHDKILELGQAPLSVVEDHINMWIHEASTASGLHGYRVVALVCCLLALLTSRL